jgi:hypothetical protein
VTRDITDYLDMDEGTEWELEYASVMGVSEEINRDHSYPS